MSHPMAAGAKASMARRLKALGAKAGKGWGAASMKMTHKYPSKNAGSQVPFFADGGSVAPRADRMARGGATKKKGSKGHTTNVVVAMPPHQPQAVPVPKPVPVPVPAGGPPGMGAGLPPARPPMAGPPIPPGVGGPPGLPPGGPPAMMKPPGMKHGGGVKKADGGPVSYSGFPKSAQGDKSATAEKRGGSVKHAKGGKVHSDEAEDKALFGKMLKAEEKKEAKHKRGGNVSNKNDEDAPLPRGKRAFGKDSAYTHGAPAKDGNTEDGEGGKYPKIGRHNSGGTVSTDAGEGGSYWNLPNAGGSGGGKGRMTKAEKAKSLPAKTEM